MDSWRRFSCKRKQAIFSITCLLSIQSDCQLQRQKMYIFCTFGYVRPAKIQISLRIRAVWSESSLDAF